MDILSVDVGYSSTKWEDDLDHLGLFPSTVTLDGWIGRDDETKLPGLPQGKNRFKELIFEGKGYRVGDDPRGDLFSRDPNFHGNNEWKLLLAMAILSSHEKSPDKDSDNVVIENLALGIPIRNSDTKAMSRLKELTTLSFTDADTGREYTATFNRVHIFSQGLSILNYVEDSTLEDTIGLVDIGHNTLDLVLIHDGVPQRRPYSESFANGIFQVFNELREAYVAKGGNAGLTDFYIRRMIQGRGLKHRGQFINMTDDINRAMANHWARISNLVVNKWADFLQDMQVITVAGGGALLMRDSLKDLDVSGVPVRYLNRSKFGEEIDIYVNADGYRRNVELLLEQETTRN